MKHYVRTDSKANSLFVILSLENEYIVAQICRA